MTTFKRSIQACGLSQSEAADYLAVSLGSIKAWSSGRTNPPEGVWDDLAALYQQMVKLVINQPKDVQFLPEPSLMAVEAMRKLSNLDNPHKTKRGNNGDDGKQD